MTDSQPDSPEPALEPEAPAEDRREERSGDHFERVMLWIIVVLIVVMSIWVEVGYHKATKAAKSVRTESNQRSRQRTDDLRASCRRGSRRTASDLNLNFVYYQTETQLSQGASNPRKAARQFEELIASLTPSEQKFIRFLLASGKPSRKILQVRANADFNAAYTKAQTVDYRDVRFVNTSTSLGRIPQPQRWVLAAHYSCDQAFR